MTRGRPDGLPLVQIADDLEMPRSVCHRLLADLMQRGNVRQPRAQGDYAMTTKLMSLGLAYLSASGIVDIAEPLIELPDSRFKLRTTPVERSTSRSSSPVSSRLTRPSRTCS